jgi:hypothetical protein
MSIIKQKADDEAKDWDMEWYALFGGVIQSFARLEHLMQITMAATGKLDLAKTVILTTGLGYQAKRDALFSLLQGINFNPNHRAQIRTFLDEADKYNGVRNNISHATWVAGSRPKSKRPMYLKVKGGKGKPIGISASDPDWTKAELRTVVDRLALITNSYTSFLKSTGYFDNIERNIARHKSRITSSPDVTPK